MTFKIEIVVYLLGNVLNQKESGTNSNQLDPIVVVWWWVGQ